MRDRYRFLTDLADAAEELFDSADLTDEDARDTGLILLGALAAGPSAERVGQVTGIPVADVQTRALALQQAGIWQDGLMHYPWLDAILEDRHQEGVAGFILDTLVADRKLIKVGEDGYQTAPETRQHGHYNVYSTHGCRCSLCRAAHRERMTACRADRMAREPPPDIHGRRSTYNNWGCRCQPCTKAHVAACRDYDRRRRLHGGPLTRPVSS